MTLDERINDVVLKQSKRLTQFFFLAAIGLYGALRSCDKKPETHVKPDTEIKINYQTPVLNEDQDFFYDKNGRKLQRIYSF